LVLVQDLQAELTSLAPALAKVRPVIDLPKGHHFVEWKKDLTTTSLRGTYESLRVAKLFRLEATHKAHERKPDEALGCHRGILNTGRSIGDEPLLLSQMVRNNLDRMACQSLVRILAQGTPTAGALLKVQKALGEEARDIKPLPLYALKAERGEWFNLFDSIAAGEMTLDQFDRVKPKPENWLQRARSWWWIQPRMRMGQAAYLEKMTRAIENAQLPVTEQRREFARFEAEVAEYKRASPSEALAMIVFPALSKVPTNHHRTCALLDCARTAVAAERYRLAHGRWPQALDQLVPEFLEKVPQDIFGTGPLRSRRLKDGLLVYSVGPDGEEEPDGLGGKEDPAFEPDVGFRLWDVDHRRRRPSNMEQRNQEP
jgi:hypothetical protein